MGTFLLSNIAFNRVVVPTVVGPSPIFWNKAESGTGTIIASEVGPFIHQNSATFAAAKFGNGFEGAQPSGSNYPYITSSDWSITFQNPLKGCFEMWIHATTGWDNNGNESIFGFMDDSTNASYFQMIGNWTNTNLMNVEVLGAIMITSVPPISVGEDHHIAVTWDFTDKIDGTLDTVRLYIDNVLKGSITTSNSFTVWGATNMAFGRQWTNVLQKYCLFDNIKGWDFAKTDFSDRFVEDSPLPTTYNVEYLVVAGGAGGGGTNETPAGAGGGAGGYQINSEFVASGSSYNVVVGDGGLGGVGLAPASPGSNSVFNPTTSIGGGRGGSYTNLPTTGGSGGGAAWVGGGGAPGAAGTGGQGNAGGNANVVTNYQGGAGGGGAGSAGSTTSASDNNGALGGDGLVLSWNSNTYATGGGGGGGYGTSPAGNAANGGSGGIHGNGGGHAGTTGNNGGSATDNTGSGGGGAGASLLSPTYTSRNGGKGGSGIVIIRYPGAQRGTGGTVTSSGGYTYHVFVGSGTYVA